MLWSGIKLIDYCKIKMLANVFNEDVKNVVLKIHVEQK